MTVNSSIFYPRFKKSNKNKKKYIWCQNIIYLLSWVEHHLWFILTIHSNPMVDSDDPRWSIRVAVHHYIHTLAISRQNRGIVFFLCFSLPLSSSNGISVSNHRWHDLPPPLSHMAPSSPSNTASQLSSTATENDLQVLFPYFTDYHIPFISRFFLNFKFLFYFEII